MYSQEVCFFFVRGISQLLASFILDIKQQQKIVVLHKKKHIVSHNVNIYQPNFVAFCFTCTALLSNRKVLKVTNFNVWVMFPSGFLMATPSNRGKFHAINGWSVK